jgi:adenylate kinase
MKNIVIFGAPGSGKGTQSELLIQKYGFKHISTGDVLRAEIAAGTELGKTAQGFIDHGQLIPDSLMIEILAHKYDELCPCEGLIFDGFPRTVAQAEIFDDLLKERGYKLDALFELVTPDEVLIERMLSRAQTSGRADDNPETIRKRVEVYHQQTAPVLDFYKARSMYTPIDGTLSIEGTAQAVADEVAALL